MAVIFFFSSSGVYDFASVLRQPPKPELSVCLSVRWSRFVVVPINTLAAYKLLGVVALA